ncbi:hypothetical protein J7J00_05270 [Bacillus sp. ISL-4]|uniref:hypothetical protein n=1 Tax=Bacillus sp. ISL-4 TaxID=2819125 RepID=UPI001BE67F92|nr:hypothetical protein [Bacillus sp. ISL-4]MBT2664897.1 hypothetical protein [Bacillus sp. ISL-4]MBT2672191.1 hypothetical protein [Streptomyces sp. ISL-14]
MIVLDSIYGKYIVEGVLEELILSIPVQRLKGIHQGGASYLVNEKWDVTRFDHSPGVMLLIKALAGSLEEQIAGLLHAVSHTAFSHVIDFVLDCKDEDYHEKIYEHVIMESEIPFILKKYGYDILAKTLKLALAKKLISLDDLLGTDEEVMSLLSSTDNHEVQNLLKRIHGNVKVIENQLEYDIHRKNKVRLIDPSVIQGTQLLRASSLSEKVKKMGIEAYKKASKGIYLKVISD